LNDWEKTSKKRKKESFKLFLCNFSAPIERGEGAKVILTQAIIMSIQNA
jgi:hypothetical protein